MEGKMDLTAGASKEACESQLKFYSDRATSKDAELGDIFWITVYKNRLKEYEAEEKKVEEFTIEDQEELNNSRISMITCNTSYGNSCCICESLKSKIARLYEKKDKWREFQDQQKKEEELKKVEFTEDDENDLNDTYNIFTECSEYRKRNGLTGECESCIPHKAKAKQLEEKKANWEWLQFEKQLQELAKEFETGPAVFGGLFGYKVTPEQAEELIDELSWKELNLEELIAPLLSLLPIPVYGEYQLCPKCNGNKTVPSAVFFFELHTCNICEGKGIIARPVEYKTSIEVKD